MLVSGGVDSTVCAALLHKALRDDQVIALHIDNGFMRKDESRKVMDSLSSLGLQLKGQRSQPCSIEVRGHIHVVLKSEVTAV